MQNSDDITDEEAGSTPQRYHAPALEKGLDILELLARETEPLGVPGIVQKLGRSTGELFRMIQVLQHRGYVEQAPGNEGYRLTGKLFALGMDQPTVRNLVEIALPTCAASAWTSANPAILPFTLRARSSWLRGWSRANSLDFLFESAIGVP